MSHSFTIPRPVRVGALMLCAFAAPGLSSAQGAQPTSPESEAPCNGEALFVLIGVPNSTRMEVELRQGKSPGSTMLKSVTLDGDGQVTFGSLCAGEYFFTYRKRGDGVYSVGGTMLAKLDAGKVSRMGYRVQMYSMPAGLVSGGKKAKAADL